MSDPEDAAPVTAAARLRRVAWALLRPWIWALGLLGGLLIAVPPEGWEPFFDVAVPGQTPDGQETDVTVQARPVFAFLEAPERIEPKPFPPWQWAVLNVAWFGDELDEESSVAMSDPILIGGRVDWGASAAWGPDELFGAERGGDLFETHRLNVLSVGLVWLTGIPALASLVAAGHLIRGSNDAEVSSLPRRLLRPWLWAAAAFGGAALLASPTPAADQSDVRVAVVAAPSGLWGPEGLWSRQLAFERRGGRYVPVGAPAPEAGSDSAVDPRFDGDVALLKAAGVSVRRGRTLDQVSYALGDGVWVRDYTTITLNLWWLVALGVSWNAVTAFHWRGRANRGSGPAADSR